MLVRAFGLSEATPLWVALAERLALPRTPPPWVALAESLALPRTWGTEDREGHDSP